MRFLIVSLILSTSIVLGKDVPTLLPVSPFDPYNDADRLFDAMDGLGANEDQITSVLCYRTASQRDVITTTYNGLHGDLVRDLKSDLSGSFETLSIMLTHDMIKFLAIELNEAFGRAGTDEATLTEIFMSRSNQELSEIRTFYDSYYGNSLVSDIEGDTSGPYEKLLVQMSEGRRDETTVVNITLVSIDVADLYKGGPAIEGTDETLYVNIFTLRNFAHLDEVAILYEETYGTALSTVVTEEFKDDMGNALVSILQYSREKSIYFASRFHNCFTGVGNKDLDLARLTVSRCEIDLGNVKTTYQTIYGVSLSSDVTDNTSGSFESALLALID